MKFFVQLESKVAPVQVARPPKSIDSLDSFTRSNGATYTGGPNLFVGLKPAKNGTYSALAVKLNIVTPAIIVTPKLKIADMPLEISISVRPDEDETPLEEEETECEVVPEESTEEEDVIIRPFHSSLPIVSIPVPTPNVELEFRKFNFNFDFAQVNENKNEAWKLYCNDKLVWIKQHGSEQLQLAHEMGMKCDSKYVVERVLSDFPAFQIHEEYAFDEMDTPEVSFLLFLRNEAFTATQKAVFKKFNSRVCLGWNYDDNQHDIAEAEVIIKGFLGMCDLVCAFKDLLIHVEQSNSRM